MMCVAGLFVQQCAAVSQLLNKLIVSIIAVWSARILHVVLRIYMVAHKNMPLCF